MQRRIFNWFFIFLLTCGTTLQASNYFQKLEKFTTEHGILNNTIFSIFQDSTGRMWFGTLEGLCSYNGKEFSCHPMSAGMPGFQLHFIDQLNKDHLMLGTTQGNYLYSISKKTYQKISFPNDSLMIQAMFRLKEKAFIATTSGIFEFDSNNNKGTKRFDAAVLCIQKSPQGNVLLGTTTKGVLEVKQDTAGLPLFTQLIPPMENEGIKAIQFMENGEIAILSDKGLYLHEDTDLKCIVKGSFSSMSLSQEGDILLGTYGDFIQQVYNDEDRYVLKDYINRENEIFNDYYDAQINVLYKDASGALWIGTNRAGLDRIDRRKISYRKFESDLPEAEAGYINALFENEQGRIWAGTSGKGLFVLDSLSGKLKSMPIFRGNLNDLYVEAIFQHKDQLFVGTRHMGIITVKAVGENPHKLQASGQLFSREAGLEKNDYIYALKQYGEKLYICSSKGTFAYHLIGKKISSLDSLASINVMIDSLDNRYILSYTLELFVNQRKVDLGTEVSDFMLAKEGGVWAATSKGLAFVENQNAKPVFYNPTSKVIEFTSLKQDQQGSLWLGSRMGIYRFDPKTKLFANYQILGGSKANSFNHGKLIKSASGDLYWGSNDGVVAIQPEQLNYLPEAHFEVVQGDKDLSGTFHVYNYSYNHQAENGIAYRFSHPDSTWMYLSAEQYKLDFSHFPKGAYELSISAINADGIMNQDVQVFKFQIRKSWTSSMILGLLFLFIILLSFIIYRLRKRGGQNQEIEKEVNETPEDKMYREWLQDDFMQNAIHVIEENLADNAFGVNELYVATQMSKSNFYRKLKKFTDLSPNELIRFVRLRKSAHLLIEAKQSVNEIAYEVGFNSPSYFTRCFKQQFGVAPSEYKEQLLMNND
ncbi:two-component regulator propeller domain-containing protein [Marinifilum caeruleilacunae]|uniref:Helix-turn-helix domain-containing protein n=1 Tax=Marinifilum caeruleilacunae TaxID=2499076 RepID=A0ABX1WUR9_9BACT|nr:two-component regulator propeller domain-containing protein [Marinifilum caeruleilacunae]NOU59675.1 helix-turn-helix domain-containing protein [Marinifilum caeruleilacunae]